jgi:tryptophan halogenase
MIINKIKNIIIFGGGTSGWLTAAYLTKNLNFPVTITLIESTAMGPIGVGEGTQPATSRFLFDSGILPKAWMKPSSASFKLGVEFVGWNDNNFFVDNDYVENSIMGPGLRVMDYFIDKPKEDFYNWLPSYRMARANKSPKLGGMDATIGVPNLRETGAVHFVAHDIVAAIKQNIESRIDYFDTKIIDITKDQNGITGLIDEERRTHTADLYIDCSGFGSVLLEKTLGVTFNSIEKFLPCNKAVAIPTEFKNPQEECHPYTKATTMTAGWMWTIPNFKRIGNGYVYSDRHITPEEAEAELRKTIGEYDAPARHLTMKCGTHSNVAHKNVVAVGLSAGFVEPLEATGITFTTRIVEGLTSLLNQQNGIWGGGPMNSLNQMYSIMTSEILAFVWCHYHYSNRNDTPFWNDIRHQRLEDLPASIQEIIREFVPDPHPLLYLNSSSSFQVGHWFELLHASGVYKDYVSRLDVERNDYAEYAAKIHEQRADLAIEKFPNHYDYLKSWYDNDNPI